MSITENVTEVGKNTIRFDKTGLIIERTGYEPAMSVFIELEDLPTIARHIVTAMEQTNPYRE